MILARLSTNAALLFWWPVLVRLEMHLQGRNHQSSSGLWYFSADLLVPFLCTDVAELRFRNFWSYQTSFKVFESPYWSWSGLSNLHWNSSWALFFDCFSWRHFLLMKFLLTSFFFRDLFLNPKEHCLTLFWIQTQTVARSSPARLPSKQMMSGHSTGSQIYSERSFWNQKYHQQDSALSSCLQFLSGNCQPRDRKLPS